MLLFILLGLALSQIDYPYSCDCSEHTTQEFCNAKQCFWNNNKCEIQKCSERPNDRCVTGSQFLSKNPLQCQLVQDKCVPFTNCESIQVNLKPSKARDHCALYKCGFDAVSGYCFEPEKCEEIRDQHTCDGLVLKDMTLCTWARGCHSNKTLISSCDGLNEYTCNALGCHFNKKCEPLTCQNRPLHSCNGEYVTHTGKVIQCMTKNNSCVFQESSLYKKLYCIEMVGHTWKDNKCSMCESYRSHSQ